MGLTDTVLARGELVLIAVNGTVQAPLIPTESEQVVESEWVYDWLGGYMYPLSNRIPRHRSDEWATVCSVSAVV